MTLLLSSSASIKETYEKEELLKLKLNEYIEPSLKIQTPSKTYIEKPESGFFTLEVLWSKQKWA